jgi:hypothetical protein
MSLHDPRYILMIISGFCGVLLSCTGGTTSASGPAPQGASGCEPKRNDNGGSSYGLAADDEIWPDVKTLLQQQCQNCHAGYADPATAAAKIDAFIRVTDLDESDDLFMPKGKPKLSLEQRALLIEWRAAGSPDGGDSADIVLGGDADAEADGPGDDGGNEDTSGIDTDGSDWGDDPPPPPSGAATGC